jgi:hypothetical protein
VVVDVETAAHGHDHDRLGHVGCEFAAGLCSRRAGVAAPMSPTARASTALLID